MRRPNIVFVLTDDQGYPPLAAHGHPFLETPHLDAFHADAIRLTDCHSGTTCAPTRAGLLTGHYANSTGVWHTVGGRSLLRVGEWTLADALKGEGYATSIFGKWHLGDEYPYRPMDRGFDKSIVHGGGGIGQVPDAWGNDYFSDVYSEDGRPKQFDGYCTDVFFKEATKFIRQKAETQTPFFCILATNAPHHPFNVPRTYMDLYRSQTQTESYARFLGMITNIDYNFGHLRTLLADFGIEENTIVIFASDNGQCNIAAAPEPSAFNSGMRGYKGSMYEGGHRIPFLVRYPRGGIVGGRDVSELTGYIDVMPTLLELCGVEVPESRPAFHGKSLVPLLKGGSVPREFEERILVTDTQRVPNPIKWRLACVMKGSFRMINRDELYDLRTDPGQTLDIAAKHPDLIEELRAAYEDWWTLCSRAFADPIPISIGHPTVPRAALTTHDLRNDKGDGVWNQFQVRLGSIAMGHHELFVVRPGIYEFELRRWPEQAGFALRTGIAEAEDTVFEKDGIEEREWGWYSGGRAIPIVSAHVEVLDGGPEDSVDVKDSDLGAKLRMDLDHGEIKVKCYFARADGKTQAAYHVYVRRTGDKVHEVKL